MLWATLWLIMGVTVGYQVWQLTALSSSGVESGQALGRAGSALQGLSGTPVIGGQTGEVGNQITDVAQGIVAGAEQAGTSIRGLSLLIGFTIVLAPTGPVLAVYLPLRRRHRRDADAVLEMLNRDGLSETLQAYLARRAVTFLSAGDLLEVSPDPHGDLESGRHHDLAAAELARLGVELAPMA